MFDRMMWLIPLCGLYVAVGVADQRTARCAQYSSIQVSEPVLGILTFCVHPF